MSTVNEAMTRLADTIRTYGNWQMPHSINSMIHEIPVIYDNGKYTGIDEEWSNRWDIIQNNGVDINDSGLFAGHGWKDEIFKPKYDLDITNANQMFWSSGIQDLKGCIERAHINFTTHRCTNFAGAFSYSKITHIPFIDMTLAKTLTNNVFTSATQLEYIEGIKVNTTNTALGNIFNNCNALKHVIFSNDSQIASNLNLKAATGLDAESITSIINALYASGTNYTLTLSQNAVDWAFSEFGAGSASADWFELIANKPTNWTITLV